MENIHCDWSIKAMSLNPNLTYEDIKTYPKIQWFRYQITYNEFSYNPYVYKTRITTTVNNSGFIISNLVSVISNYI